MIILPESGGMAMTNCFVIADESSKEAVLFDAPDPTLSPPFDEVPRPGWDPPRPAVVGGSAAPRLEPRRPVAYARPLRSPRGPQGGDGSLPGSQGSDPPARRATARQPRPDEQAIHAPVHDPAGGGGQLPR